MSGLQQGLKQQLLHTGQRAELNVAMTSLPGPVNGECDLSADGGAQPLPAEAAGLSALAPASIAHDLNNLFMILENSAADLLAYPDQAVRAKADLLLKTTRAAISLTSQLLPPSQGKFQPTQFSDLNQLLADILPAMRALAGSAVRVEFRPAPEQFSIYVDPDQLQQVLLNLTANARDAMRGGGELLISTEAESISSPAQDLLPGRYIRIAVSDTGTGMNDEARQRAFEPRFTTRHSAGNSGLGLAIAAEILKRHRGSIRLTETSDRGTKFHVYLPLVPATAGIPDSERLILVVEDSDELRRMLEGFLLSQGYTVLARSSSDEMLEAVSAGSMVPNVIVIDVLLAGTPAPEVVSTLQQSHADLKAIFISGRAITGEGMPQLPAGAQFLQKPFSLSVLANTVDRLLASNASAGASAENI